MTVCELDESVSVIDIGSATSGKWRKIKPKRMSWQITSGHLVSDAQQSVDLDSILTTEQRIQVAFIQVDSHPSPLSEPPTYTPSSSADAFKRYGFCYITRLTVSARNKDFATMSVTFTGDGPLSKSLT